MSKVYKFRIELEKSDPQIWREFLVLSDITFYRLHHIIQIVMGWENYHLYEFTMDKCRIGHQLEDEGIDDPDKIIDSRNLKIDEMLSEIGQKLSYLYDFGDYWQHSVTLERIIDNLNIPFPICCNGELNCPPEDVGSLPGFYDFLKILENPKHPEYKDYKKWVKGKSVSSKGTYDPKRLNTERVNYLLLNLDVNITDWENELNG